MPASEARLDLRLSSDDKARIERAAGIRGVAVAAFVREAVLREAAQVAATELAVTLSPESLRRFLRVLDAPFRPNTRLKRAVERAGRR